MNLIDLQIIDYRLSEKQERAKSMIRVKNKISDAKWHP